jgi:hypothetical protein
VTELDPGAKELIALVGDADGPTERQRSRLRAAVLAEMGAVGGTALAESVGRAAANAAAGVAGAGAAGAVASLGAGAVGAGAGAGGAAIAGGVAFAAKMVAIGAVLTGIGTGGYVVVSHQHREKLVAVGATAPAASTSERLVAIGATAARAPAAVPAPAPEAPPSAATATDPPVSPEETAPPPPPAAAAAPRPRPRPDSVPEVIPETFEEETQALREAVSALRGGHPETVLPALAAQDAKYPHGVLGEERAVARIEALCALGRTREANALASRFLAQHPRSLQAVRVRASCGVAQGAP